MSHLDSVKLFRHTDRVKEFLDTGVTRPVSMVMHLSNECNLGCWWCSGKRERSGVGMLGVAEAKFILDQAVDFGIKSVTINGGGEPLVNPMSDEIIRYIRKIGLEVGVVTNGTLIDKKLAETLVDTCSWVRISLDASSADEWANRGKGNHDQFRSALSGIVRLVETRKLFRTKCKIGIKYLVSTCYYNVDEALRLAKFLGVDYCQISPIIGAADDYADIYRNIKDREDLAISHDQFRCLISGGNRCYGKCYSSWFTTAVSVDMSVWVCCQTVGKQEFLIGNLADNTLERIWLSDDHISLVNSIDVTRCIPCCRNNGLNEILWRLVNAEHVNFV